MVRIKTSLYFIFFLNFNLFSQEVLKGVAKYRNTLELSGSANRRVMEVALFFNQQESMFKDYIVGDFNKNGKDTIYNSSGSNVYEL